jgi:hypothetical protein
MIHTSSPNSKPYKTFVVPVGNMPAKRKKWWQFWRKKGDSAEEFVKQYSAFNINRYHRKSKASELWGIHRPDWEKEPWFPNK